MEESRDVQLAIAVAFKAWLQLRVSSSEVDDHLVWWGLRLDPRDRAIFRVIPLAKLPDEPVQQELSPDELEELLNEMGQQEV